MRSIVLGLLVSLCSARAAAQSPAQLGRESVPVHTLATARAVFARSDVDRDGLISAAEARASGVAANAWVVFDGDGDGVVGPDEFVLGYRRYVAGAGHRVAPDLEAEAARLQALQRARMALESRTQGPAAGRLSGAETARPRGWIELLQPPPRVVPEDPPAPSMGESRSLRSSSPIGVGDVGALAPPLPADAAAAIPGAGEPSLAPPTGAETPSPVVAADAAGAVTSIAEPAARRRGASSEPVRIDERGRVWRSARREILARRGLEALRARPRGADPVGEGRIGPGAARTGPRASRP